MSNFSWTPYRLAVAVAAAISLLASFSSDSQRLEGLLILWGSHLIPEAKQADSVAVVAIDAASLPDYGPWPLPRDQLVRVVKRVQRFDPKAVGLMLDLTGAETAHAVGTLREELDSLDASLRKKAKAWLARLDTDKRLAQALKKSRALVLVMPSLATAEGARLHQTLGAFTIDTESEALAWHRLGLQQLLSSPLTGEVELAPPLPVFIDTVSGVGVNK